MAAPSHGEAELQTLKLTILLYVIAFAVKLVGYFLTGIMVLLADALHSLSDLFIYGFLLVAMIWSRKEADEVHMFGYGRARKRPIRTCRWRWECSFFRWPSLLHR